MVILPGEMLAFFSEIRFKVNAISTRVHVMLRLGSISDEGSREVDLLAITGHPYQPTTTMLFDLDLCKVLREHVLF